MGLESELILRYFGKAMPLMQQAIRTLPAAGQTLQRSLASKRLPATQQVPDKQLIEQMFAKHDKHGNEKH